MTGKTHIIAISAVSGGGKTTVTNKLLELLPSAKALYFDDRDYDIVNGINDICEWVKNGGDANVFDLKLLADDINDLLNASPDFILLDYPFGYRNDLIAKYMDLSVYIDTPLDIALARRIIRDYDNTTVSNIFNEMDQYLTHGRNAYLNLDLTRKSADFVVDGSKSVDDIADDIKQEIYSRFSL